MKLNRTPNPLDRSARNGENDNWEKIEGSIKRIDDTVSDLVLESGGDSNLEVVQARGGKPVLNDRLVDIETELTEKANRNEVRKNTDNQPIDVDEMNTRTKQLFTGGAVAVVGENAVGSENVKPQAITTEKTDFARTSVNMFDKTNVIEGYRIHGSTGLVEDPAWMVSDFIPCEQGVILSKSHASVVTQYTQDKTYLSQTGNNSATFTTVSGTKFIRVSILRNLRDTYQLEEGLERTPYEPYGRITIKKLNVLEENLEDVITDKINNGLSQEGYKSGNKLQKYPNEIFNLLDNEHALTTVACSVKLDNSILWRGPTYKMKCDGSATGDLRFDPIVPTNIPPSSAVGLWVFIEDITNISNIYLDLYHNEVLNPYWTRSIINMEDFQLKNGWNLLRWDAATSSMGDWEKLYRIRIRVVNTGKTEINIGSVFMESSDKAKLILVNDGGRKSWLNIAYPELKQRGFPTTWALNPNGFGSHEDKMTEEEVLSLIYDLESSFSFHSYGSGTPTAQMTERETREDALRCIRYLKSKGLASDYIWRAAVHQNTAPYHRINDDLLIASATYTGTTGGSPLAFPFTRPYNIPRSIMHYLTNEQMDSIFDLLKKTRGIYVGYTHGIFDAGGTEADMSLAQWEYFLSKIDEGISEGWLEGTTVEDLYGQIANPKRVNVLEQLTLATRL